MASPKQTAYDNELARINAMPKGSARVRAKEAFDAKYPNGRPTDTGLNEGSTNTATDGTNQALAFGLTKALIEAYPELKPVWELFLAGNITDAKLAYYETNYFKNLSTASKNRANAKVTQPGVYAQELEKFILSEKKRLIGRGIKLDDAALTLILTEAYDQGLSSDQIDLKVLTKTKSPFGGDTLESVQSLNQYANAFGITYGQKDIDQWSRDIFAGLTTVADVQAKIRMDSASAFPAYASQIEKGVSLEALASAYKSSMANILERDPDSISFEDPYLRRALQYTQDGKPAIKPLWEFEKELRSTPEWEYTNNARDVIDSLSLKVLRDWGLA